MATTRKPKGLGRGLDALLGEDADILGDLGKASDILEGVKPIAIKQIKAGKYQPRTLMDEGALNELADSIKSQGLMQPILLRPIKKTGQVKYEIVAGERRYRAAQIAGLKEIPALVRDIEDKNAAIMALIENMQREDLNPLEEAQGVKRLIDEFGYTHEQAAQAIGRSRSATSNLLRLINLAEPVQTMLLAGDIDMGHARALLAVEAAAQIMLANEVIARRLTVRETERLVARFLNGEINLDKNAAPQQKEKNSDVKRFETVLADYLGTSVNIKANAKNKGYLQIAFQDWEHLNDLLERQGLLKLFEEQ
ncbi:ParB/RepB/Spo0J family partition protein [Paenalcaligenes hominis]|uniref:Chromosome partitioning protein ParB n=1 Tax=Paenalcaligenes hominis TaxID=643674 RepID=A0A1U9K0I9_9BURK|nr:ParB/RepB/Spo0J family partition protein [Paenalcaligenes hominis]AQS51547.1 chromosome partitioning protein ParB [Paenalcaligenes hominis]